MAANFFWCYGTYKPQIEHLCVCVCMCARVGARSLGTSDSGKFVQNIFQRFFPGLLDLVIKFLVAVLEILALVDYASNFIFKFFFFSKFGL